MNPTIDSTLHHGLLLPVAPPYSGVTLRRAFVVWSACGELLYRPACNYYHYLEEMESKMSPSEKASSRQQDLNLFNNEPPKSTFLNEYFPSLYKKRSDDDIAEKHTNVYNTPVFQVRGFHNIAGINKLNNSKRVTLEAAVRKFCLERRIDLNSFLNDFKKYIKFCKLEFHVLYLIRFMLNKNIGSDLILFHNMPRDFDFLQDAVDEYSNIKAAVYKAINNSKSFEMNNKVPNNNDKQHKMNNVKFEEFIKQIKYDNKNINKCYNDKLNLNEKIDNLNKKNVDSKHNFSLDRDDNKKVFTTKLNKTDVEVKKVKQRKSRNVVVLNTSNESVKSFFEYHHQQIKLMENLKLNGNGMMNDIINDKSDINDSSIEINETPIDYKEFVDTIAELSYKVNISSENHYICSDKDYVKIKNGRNDKSISILNSSMIEDHFGEISR